MAGSRSNRAGRLALAETEADFSGRVMQGELIVDSYTVFLRQNFTVPCASAH
jgi:hypothetical protein